MILFKSDITAQAKNENTNLTQQIESLNNNMQSIIFESKYY